MLLTFLNTVECYCIIEEKVNIPVIEYEQQGRSAPFQIALRECSKEACNEDGFSFVHAPLL